MRASPELDLQPLELLFERPDLPQFDLPLPLLAEYGGSLGFSRPRLFANLVASVDGVVALPASTDSGQIISGHNRPDRFVMGLLRACADAVIVGAGTFRKSPGHVWHPETIFPARAALYAELRQRLGLSTQPTLVLVTASGRINTNEPALRDAWIVTTRSGEALLRAQAPSLRIAVLGADRIRFADVLALIHEQGSQLVLTEGGPTLFAQLVAEKLLDELFLTSSPALFGRHSEDRRKSLADGLDLAGAPLELLSARRDGSHLFFRYARIREEETGERNVGR